MSEIKLLFFLKGEIILRENFLRKRQQHNREKFFHQGRKRRKKTQKDDEFLKAKNNTRFRAQITNNLLLLSL